MSDEVDAAARRYSRDMRRIREYRNVSIEDVHEETRIAQTLIESFEDSTLYDHPSFNRIYLRSFIRVYAEAIELPPEEALEALDAALEGTYQGTLSDRYLGEGAAGVQESFEAEESSSSPSQGEQEESEAAPESESSDSFQGSTPPAGGMGGRGGIVGPARAVGQDDEGASQEEEPDSEREASPSLDSKDDSLSPGEETPPREASSDASTSDDDSHSFSVWDQDDEDSESEDPEREKTPQSFSEADTPEEPIGPGSAIGPVRELDADDEPDESHEDESHESHEEPSRESDSYSPSPPDAEEEVEASLEGGVSGIVGGPKELGSSSTGSPPSEDSKSSSLGTSRPPEPPRQTSFQESKNRKRRKILFSGLGVLILIGVLTGLTLYYSSVGSSNEDADVSTTSEDTTQTVAVQDTSAAPTPTEQRPPATVSFGDTVAVTIVAESNLSEIRIQRNGDVRRPYWIEEGDAVVFPFTSRITFENDLDDARFFLEQYPYSSPERDEQGRVVIDRNTLETFSDTLRGEPQPLSVTPDTIPIGSPIPEGILE